MGRWPKNYIFFRNRKGGFQVIRLFKIFWKAVISLLNRWIAAAIYFHDTLRGFWEGRGMGTAALEAKILQQLTDMR